MQKEHQPVCPELRMARYIRRVWKIRGIKIWTNRYLGTTEALVCYWIAEETKTEVQAKMSRI